MQKITMLSLFLVVLEPQRISSFAFEGAAGSIDPSVKDFIQAFHQAETNWAVCIAPALLALITKDLSPLAQIREQLLHWSSWVPNIRFAQ